MRNLTSKMLTFPDLGLIGRGILELPLPVEPDTLLGNGEEVNIFYWTRYCIFRNHLSPAGTNSYPSYGADSRRGQEPDCLDRCARWWEAAPTESLGHKCLGRRQ